MTTHFLKSFTRPAMAATLSAALALTPLTATPAHANDGDAAGAIAAVGLLALLFGGIALSQQDHGNTVTGGWTVEPTKPVGPGLFGPRGPGVQPRPSYSKVLPSKCRVIVQRGNDRGRYFESRCLMSNYTQWRNLPRTCSEQVNRPGRLPVTGFRASCLIARGYIADDRGPRGRR